LTQPIEVQVKDGDAVRTERRDPFFRPEFVNRVDELLLFNTFGTNQYKTILTNLIDDECARLSKEKGKTVRVDPALAADMVRQCVARSDEGARVCGKLLDTMVVGPVIDFFVAEGNRDVPGVVVRLNDGAPDVVADRG